MDQYLSIPGTYAFVRRAPEDATSHRVMMTVFEDFLCPSCYAASQEVFPALKQKYGERLEVHYLAFPFIHPESRLAARAYAIAQELGFGEAMQKALFHTHFEQSGDIESKEGLARVADSIGLAPETLLAQLEGDGGNAALDRISAQAEAYRIDGTPTLILDGWIKITDISQSNIEKVLDGVLEKKNLAASPSAQSARPPTSPRKAAP